MCCSEHVLGWLTVYHVISDVGLPHSGHSHSIVRVTLKSCESDTC